MRHVMCQCLYPTIFQFRMFGHSIFELFIFGIRDCSQMHCQCPDFDLNLIEVLCVLVQQIRTCCSELALAVSPTCTLPPSATPTTDQSKWQVSKHCIVLSWN